MSETFTISNEKLKKGEIPFMSKKNIMVEINDHKTNKNYESN